MTFVTNQQTALKKLTELRHGALFMSMGSGKTKVVIDLATSRQHDFDIVLWIAPASLINDGNYRSEIDKWARDLNREIVFQTVEGISQSDTQYLDLNTLVERKRAFTVIDESSTIKNVMAKRTTRLLQLRDKLAFRFILNGTPTSKGLLDLWAQLEFISPKILNMTEAQFANHFLTYRNEGYMPWRRWSRPANEEALVEMMRPYIVECDLELDVALKESLTRFNMSPEQADEYSLYKREFDPKQPWDFLAAIQKMQQVYTQVPAKLDGLKEIADYTERVYVLVKYHEEVNAIKDRFGEQCIEYTGRQKDDLELFRSGKKKICVATYGTGALGLNLQQCHDVVFFSQTWAYQDRVQAIHRVRRIGQTEDINVWDFQVNTGLEKMIVHCQDKKQNTLDYIKECIQKEGVDAL